MTPTGPAADIRLRDVILEISARLASLLDDDLDEGIEGALAEVGRLTAVDRAYVMTFDGAGATFTNTHEWVADGVSSEKGGLTAIPLETLSPWYATLARGDAVQVASVAKLDAAVVSKASFEAQSIRSMLWVPMPGPGGLRGLVGFDSVRSERSWWPDEVTLLRAVANVIAAALERGAATAERDAADRRLRELAALFPGVMYQLHVAPDGRLRIPYSSPGLGAVFGVDPETVRDDASSVFDAVHVDDHEALRSALERSRATLEPLTCEFRVVTPAPTRWFRGHATPERLPDGATIWHGVTIEITEARAMAAALREREAIFDRITRSLRDIVVLTDGRMRITFVTPSIEGILGHRPEDVIGERVTTFLHQDDVEDVLQRVAATVDERGTTTLTARALHLDGTVRYLETQIHVVSDDRGVTAGVFSARDVTERRSEHARLEREVAFRKALVHVTNDMLVATFDDRFYEDVLDHAIELVPDAQSGSMMLRDEDGRFRFVAVMGFDIDALRDLRLTPEELARSDPPRVERIFVRETVQRLSVVGHDAIQRAGRFGEIEVTLSVPIVVTGETRGYLNLDNFERSDAFDADAQGVAEALAAQVAVALQRLQLERRLGDERARYEVLASHDPLTNLPNRRLFLDRLEQAIARAGRRNERVALLYLDLDGFKAVNDTHGHDVGDELLAAVAGRLVRSVRAEDTVARLGGDEFAVVLEGVSTQRAAQLVATKLLETFRTPFSLSAGEIGIGASIGVAVYPRDARRTDGLMKAADTAMYRVKDTGRGAYALYSGGA